jgi:DNA gyrase/topoisomerase IV subunit A
MNGKSDADCAKDPIKFFKLSKSFTENYTALDEQGELILFDTKVEIIKKFVDFRIKKIQDQLDYDIEKHKQNLIWLNAKLCFVTDVLNDNINFKKVTRKELTNHCISCYNVTTEMATRLVNISLVDITTDAVEVLNKQIAEIHDKIVLLEKTDAKKELVKRLDVIIKKGK